MLNGIVAESYARVHDARVEGFARFVYSKGSGAMPDTGKKAGMTWQAIGRRMYGKPFVDALKRIVEEQRGV